MTGVDWAGHACRLREHAAADAARRTADTGHTHRPDETVLGVASRCDAAAYSPDRPNPRLAQLVADTLAARPAPRPQRSNFDLSSSSGPDAHRHRQANPDSVARRLGAGEV